MNIPNRLSIIRICLVPVCVALLYINTQATNIIGLIIFLIASFTDFLDGHIARSQNIVTNFGKFIDPVADKLLVLCTMAMLVSQDKLSVWLLIIILFRELSVDGLRMVGSRQGHVIAAGMAGKIKTITQIITVIIAIIGDGVFGPIPMLAIFSIVTAIMTILSGVQYFKQYWPLLMADLNQGAPNTSNTSNNSSDGEAI